jgi:2-dehydropantoate 2-reductase
VSDRRRSAVIVGAGAIGGWLAALLHDGGFEVKLLARGATLAAVRGNGLVYEAGGARRSLPLQASDDPAALGPADYVVVALKGQAMPEVGPILAPLIGPDTAIVSAMNGVPWWFLDGFGGPLAGQALESVDPGGRLKSLYPARRVIGAVVHASAVAEAPGVVRLVLADKLTFGEPDGSSTPRLERLVEACRKAGMNTFATADVRLDIWAKLWGNMSTNPISALTRATTLRVLDDPETRRLIVEMMGEMAAVGHDIGLDLGMTPADRMVVTRRLGDFKTSMLHDVEAGRPLELDGLLGVLVEMADRLERPVPFLRAVHGLARVLSASVSGN